MRERGEAEGNAYREKMLAKWKADEDKVHTDVMMIAKFRTDREEVEAERKRRGWKELYRVMVLDHF
jgi:hypothetical protein